MRQISNVFGNGVFVSGLTLAAVFFGITLGVLLSAKLARFLPILEILIGICAISSAFAFYQFGFAIFTFGGTSTAATVAKLFVLLVLPMILIGGCVPLFADRVQNLGGFNAIYGLYNLGAATSVLVIEFWLFRQFGLLQSLIIMGTINLCIGTLLWIFSSPSTGGNLVWPKMSRPLAAFCIASIASGIFQFFVLKYTNALFGPLNENFALVIFFALIGIAIGTALFNRFRPKLGTWLLGLGVTIIYMSLLAKPTVFLWVELANLSTSSMVLGINKFWLCGALFLPSFIAFGGLLPAFLFLGSYRAVLAISSVCNGLGALMAFTFLFRILPLEWIGALCAVIIITSLFLLLERRPIRWLVGTATIGATAFFWPTDILQFGYRNFLDKRGFYSRLDGFETSQVYRSFDQYVAVLTFKGDFRALVLNGYQSLMFGPNQTTALQEKTVGLTPALFAERTNTALVLGLGSGITAGATASVFDQVDVAEINPSMIRVLAHFNAENDDISNNHRVNIRIEDGISTILARDQKYDAIVNTVTSPKFYSAAKLYTADVLMLFKNRLADGGVYSSWFDVTIGERGIETMKATLESVFGQCRYFLLSSGYFNVTCAKGDLPYQASRTITQRTNATAFKKDLEKIGITAEIADLFSALEIDLASLETDTTAVATLDRPLFEFGQTSKTSSAIAGGRMHGVLDAALGYRKKTDQITGTLRIACEAQQPFAARAFEACK